MCGWEEIFLWLFMLCCCCEFKATEFRILLHLDQKTISWMHYDFYKQTPTHILFCCWNVISPAWCTPEKTGSNELCSGEPGCLNCAPGSQRLSSLCSIVPLMSKPSFTSQSYANKNWRPLERYVSFKTMYWLCNEFCTLNGIVWYYLYTLISEHLIAFL